MHGEGSELRPVYALLQVLLQTFSALGLGFLCTGFGYVDVQRGELQGIQFFVSRIALPLLVFRVIATGNLADVEMGVLIACSLGKMAVFCLTWFAAFLGYRTRNSTGDRILTSSIFGFFTVASNDLAVGFPVVYAIYGDDMAVYVAANVLIFQVVFQPFATIIFEVGHAVSVHEQARDRASSPMLAIGSWKIIRVVAGRVSKAIVFNQIIIATAAGAAFAVVYGSHLPHDETGRRRLPAPLEGVVKLWTSPFTMLFLFLNGAALKSARIALWPMLLVLMKVVACAYISYGLSYIFIGDSRRNSQQLRNFVFFYGTIPSGGAPLIYAQLFECGADVVASASLFGLVLSGPIEVMTALYLSHVSGKVNYADVHHVLRGAARAGVFCSGTMALLIAAGWWGASFISRAVGVFAVASFLFEAWTIFVLHNRVWACDSHLVLFVFRFLQNICYFVVIYLEYHIGRTSRGGWRERLAAMLPIVMAAAVLPARLQTYCNTFHELCGLKPTISEAFMLVAWNSILLVLIVTVAVRARLRKRQSQGETLLVPLFGQAARAKATTEAKSDGDGVGVAMTLVVLQSVRCLMEVINSVGSWRNPSGYDDFEPMLIMSTCLEHGQGCFVLVAALLEPALLARTRTLLERLQALLGWSGSGVLVELDAFTPSSRRNASKTFQQIGNLCGQGGGSPLG